LPHDVPRFGSAAGHPLAELVRQDRVGGVPTTQTGTVDGQFVHWQSTPFDCVQ
jgi:hypothetical protein